MTSSSALSPAVSGISKELAEMRHLVQFPEEIACILTEQEQQLYQRVRGIYSHIKNISRLLITCEFACGVTSMKLRCCKFLRGAGLFVAV